MLRDLKTLLDAAILGTDGMIGTVKDLYFDDFSWVIRYFVVGTGSWLSARRVLISPLSISAPTDNGRTLASALTQAQVRNSPPIDTDQPVSRQHELDYLRYYGYACYWSGGTWRGHGAHPGSLAKGLGGENVEALRQTDRVENARLDAEADAEHRPHGDYHLRSCETVMTYHVEAIDGDIGHVAGYLLDPTSWAIRYLVVDDPVSVAIKSKANEHSDECFGAPRGSRASIDRDDKPPARGRPDALLPDRSAQLSSAKLSRYERPFDSAHARPQSNQRPGQRLESLLRIAHLIRGAGDIQCGELFIAERTHGWLAERHIDVPVNGAIRTKASKFSGAVKSAPVGIVDIDRCAIRNPKVFGNGCEEAAVAQATGGAIVVELEDLARIAVRKKQGAPVSAKRHAVVQFCGVRFRAKAAV